MMRANVGIAKLNIKYVSVRVMKEKGTMKIAVSFFDNKIIEAIGGGIYKISVKQGGEHEVLYIGESFSMLIRCAAHLYTLSNSPEYFGFTDETIERTDITIVLEVLEVEKDKYIRKQKEKQYIKDYKPITQSGISDRMKSVEDKIAALEEYLDK